MVRKYPNGLHVTYTHEANSYGDHAIGKARHGIIKSARISRGDLGVTYSVDPVRQDGSPMTARRNHVNVREKHIAKATTPNP